ncbi:hypothetical protein D043_4116A, partial [Vibrio parahaemolyticus EKP-021]
MNFVVEQFGFVAD